MDGCIDPNGLEQWFIKAAETWKDLSRFNGNFDPWEKVQPYIEILDSKINGGPFCFISTTIDAMDRKQSICLKRTERDVPEEWIYLRITELWNEFQRIFNDGATIQDFLTKLKENNIIQSNRFFDSMIKGEDEICSEFCSSFDRSLYDYVNNMGEIRNYMDEIQQYDGLKTAIFILFLRKVREWNQ